MYGVNLFGLQRYEKFWIYANFVEQKVKKKHFFSVSQVFPILFPSFSQVKYLDDL